MALTFARPGASPSASPLCEEAGPPDAAAPVPLLIHSANSPLAVAWGLELGRLFFSLAVYLPEKRGKESEHKMSPRAGEACRVIGSLCVSFRGRPSCGEHGDRGTRLLTHVNVPARSWRLGFHAASNELSSTTDGEKGGSQPRTQEEKTKSSLLLRTWAIYTPLSRTRTVSTSE